MFGGGGGCAYIRPRDKYSYTPINRLLACKAHVCLSPYQPSVISGVKPSATPPAHKSVYIIIKYRTYTIVI